MCFLFKTLFRTAVIGAALTAAVAGGTAMIVGPDRVGAFADQVKGEITSTFDDNLDDPTVLRRNLRNIEKQYPDRIKTVRGDLYELRQEMTRLQREKGLSEKMVQLIDADLDELRPVLAEITEAREEGHARLVSVVLNDDVMSYRRAKAKVTEIERLRAARLATAADAEHQLKYLVSQEDRFEELLGRLEEEQAELAAQIVQLENEIESVERNENLIKMLEERQQTLDEAEKFGVRSLEQFAGALERKRMQQEAELDRLFSGVETQSYEERAAASMDGE